MKFGMLMELQFPKPWLPDGERKFFQDCLDQVELADQLGFDCAWEVEHHFLEEYAHSSSPEVFLAACSQRTSRIRLGHGIVLMPPGYNQTARVAERIATLDLVSNGRVEFGTGESASRSELEGYGVPLEKKHEMFVECAEQAANMLAMDPYPGFQGKYLSMPCRNVVPKPVQKPHPPMWMACSNRNAIHVAAQLGLGALTFAFVGPEEAKHWIDDYYNTIQTDCTPIGHTVNANIAMTVQMSLDHDDEKARQKGLDGTMFFGLASGHYYGAGVHKPGRINLWERLQSVREAMLPNAGGAATAIGTPDQCRDLLRKYREAGADQAVFVMQAGKNRHEDICQTMEMFAEEVLPEFHAGEEEREEAKAKSLKPYVEEALERKTWMKPLKDEDIPAFAAFNRPIAEEGKATGGELEQTSFEVGARKLLEQLGLAEEEEAPKGSTKN